MRSSLESGGEPFLFDEINDFIFGITGLYTEKSEVFRNLPPVECSICGDTLVTEFPFL